MREEDEDIVIVGGGIIGLTVSVYLLEKGRRVKLLTKEPIPKTNSAKAAASWFPSSDQQPILQRLCIESYPKLIELSKISGTGVFIDNPIIPFKTQAAFNESPWAKKEIRELVGVSFNLPKDYKPLPDSPTSAIAFTAKIPVFTPKMHLNYLFNRFIALGGKFSTEKIDRLEDLSASFPVIINCTGWEAKALTNDPSVFPIRGQLEIGKSNSMTQNLYSLHYPDLNAYTIFRKPSEEWVLGTTYQVNDSNKEISATDRAEIHKKCSQFFPVKALGKTTSTVGIRCGRHPDVRIEKEILNNSTIIHCYGHDGNGYSAAWGSARKTLELCFPSALIRCSL